MDYTIVYQYGKDVKDAIIKLEDDVKKNYIGIGFEPIGGISIKDAPVYKDNGFITEIIACQAMVKRS